MHGVSILDQPFGNYKQAIVKCYDDYCGEYGASFWFQVEGIDHLHSRLFGWRIDGMASDAYFCDVMYEVSRVHDQEPHFLTTVDFGLTKWGSYVRHPDPDDR